MATLWRRRPWDAKARQATCRAAFVYRCCSTAQGVGMAKAGEYVFTSLSAVRLGAWRTMPTIASLQRIDLLTYRLGRYPNPSSSSIPPTDTLAQTSGVAQKRCRNARTRSLDALVARNVLSRGVPRLTIPQTNTGSRVSTTPLCGSETVHPFTPLKEVKALAKQQYISNAIREERLLHDAEAAKLQREQLLTHPDRIFSDEVSILRAFGMGWYASPAVAGFHGLFRQRWQDFSVTEMYTDWTSMIGGSAVSRHLDFTVPPLPSHLLDTNPDSKDSNDAARKDPVSSFFHVDVASRVAELLREHSPTVSGASTSLGSMVSSEGEAKLTPCSPTPSGNVGKVDVSLLNDPTTVDDGSLYYLQCTLRKCHIAHSVAMSNLSQTLRIHPKAISVSGMKDFIGDTVQRVRLQNVSPTAALDANRVFRKKGSKMTLSDFSYEAEPLSPGDLFGNHFRIVLRDVTAPKAVVEDALQALQIKGFPNYYGCQRFSWFGGETDAAWALLRQNWLVFAFRFLNYTSKDRSLRELLQRRKKYPHPVQDAYRRNLVRRLRRIAVEPKDLDESPFLSCPSIWEPITCNGGGKLNQVHELILLQLKESYFDLDPQSRRLTAQRLSSYLWNQVLTLRLHHFGSETVLAGDHVAPASVRQMCSNTSERKDWLRAHGAVVTKDNISQYGIRDVLHPGFSFEGGALPENAVGSYYLQLCNKYHLDWESKLGNSGLHDFREPPRPIIRHPMQVKHDYNVACGVLTLEFALERGCYANVALTELMKLSRCAGSDDVLQLPAHESLWDTLGARDPGYVTPVQDIYEGFEAGVGFVGDKETVSISEDTQPKIWESTEPLFLPDSEDPYVKASAWGKENLLRNMQRRIRDADRWKRQLFEKPLADKLSEGEIDCYAGHTVPLPPNAHGKRIFFKVLRRKQRYAGAPRTVPRAKRGAHISNRNHNTPAFKTLNRNTWNVMW